MAVTCPYCNETATLTTGAELYSRHPQLAERKVWICRPSGAWVGCRGTSEVPLGSLADGKLRAARQAGHAAFDPLWQTMMAMNRISMSDARATAYGWLAEQPGVTADQCRFGGMDYEMCISTTLICRELLAVLDADRGTLDLL